MRKILPKLNFKHLSLFIILAIIMQLSGCTILEKNPAEKEESIVEPIVLETNHDRMVAHRKYLNEDFSKFFNRPIEETYYWNQYLACSTDTRAYDNLIGRKEGEKVFFYTTYDNVYETALYLDLSAFNLSTGQNLTLKDIEAFFSKEYEDNGTLRFYNNGKHPLIEQFVLWALTPNNEISLIDSEYKFTSQDYGRDVTQIIKDYVAEHPEIAEDVPVDKLIGISWKITVSAFSLEDADEIMKKYEDPDYELHLSLEGKVE